MSSKLFRVLVLLLYVGTATLKVSGARAEDHKGIDGEAARYGAIPLASRSMSNSLRSLFRMGGHGLDLYQAVSWGVGKGQDKFTSDQYQSCNRLLGAGTLLCKCLNVGGGGGGNTDCTCLWTDADSQDCYCLHSGLNTTACDDVDTAPAPAASQGGRPPSHGASPTAIISSAAAVLLAACFT